ncbi:MAG: N-acetylmuramoyl-L-alanine amidase [Desulfobacterales bacterium]|nr:MAG: N-acetylmuramoyl-L-alanine amidase [Desulfobacterales bacterium]UCG80389.1 MAG: N-acetylmuramoyl-L-alanine amidase [Desulfobacterales bacterium]
MMDRRRFLKWVGKGILSSSGVWLGTRSIAWGKSAFDYALEGQDLIAAKRFAEARDVLMEAVRLDPTSDWAHGLLGRAYHGLNQNAEAVEAFRKAVRLNPADTYSRMMIEIITQKPINKLKKPPQPLSPLEKKAKAEEEAMLGNLSSEGGLTYQVKRVVIDPGHGGFDSGAVGPTGLKEKDVALDLAQRVNQEIAKTGKIKSFLTRTDDYYIPLSDRTVIANQYQADLFVSIHINANENRKAQGCETYFCSETASSKEAARVAAFENAVLQYDEPFKKRPGYIDIEQILFHFERRLYWKESGKFAGTFQNHFQQALPFKSRGVHSANFFVLRRAKMPSILLETGFISNHAEESELKKVSVRDKIAAAVVRGIFHGRA